MNTLTDLMKKLKELGGFHHGLILLVISWLGFLIHPLFGIYLALRIDGYYFGREEKEAERRGFDPLDPQTWELVRFEVWDFMTPFILGHLSIAAMIFLAGYHKVLFPG